MNLRVRDIDLWGASPTRCWRARRARLVVSTIVPAATLLGGGVAAAEPEFLEAEQAHARMDRVDREIGRMKADLDDVAEGYQSPLRREGGRLQRRLREAEVQALLGDHYRASIVLLDVTERAELKAHPQYNDAVFLLAESLRKSGNVRAARAYYEQLAKTAEGERLGQVVLGLLEAASVTGDFSGVEDQVRRLKASTVTSERPKIDFSFGKALFRGAEEDVTRLSRALRRFRSVPEGLSVSAPAAYYAGVTLVRMGRLDEAVKAFERTLELSSSHPDAERVRELANLSLGRLHQERGELTAALDAYQAISKDSPYFTDMLYEVAWTHVKAAEQASGNENKQRRAHRRALDAIELLMAAEPDARLYPDARVLQGNLQIRLGAPDTAYDTFEGIVDRYGGARQELGSALASRRDPRSFFDQLVAADLQDLNRSTLLPPVVVQFALDEPNVSRAVAVRKDLAKAAEDLEEAREMVRTLETALQSEQRFGMFPGLRKARLRALSVQNRLLAAERQLLTTERHALTPHLTPAELAALDAIRSRARGVENDIDALPTTDAGIEGSRRELKSAYEKVSHRAYRLLSRLRATRAQLVAASLWIQTQGVRLDPEDRKLTAQRMQAALADITSIEAALEGIDGEVARAGLLSRGDGGWARAERLRRALYQAIDEQAASLEPVRARLPDDLKAVSARVQQQRSALRALERDLTGLQTRLEQTVDARVDEVRTQVIESLKNLDIEQAEHVQLAGQADQLLGPVAEQTFEIVDDEIRDLVMEADVGILDVAWARKQARTEKVTELVQELRQRSTELEDEFDEVLEDE